jgi:hypothetical protein
VALISQKMIIIIVTAVETSNLTNYYASYVVSENLAKKIKSFSEMEIKNNLGSVADVTHSD